MVEKPTPGMTPELEAAIGKVWVDIAVRLYWAKIEGSEDRQKHWGTAALAVADAYPDVIERVAKAAKEGRTNG